MNLTDAQLRRILSGIYADACLDESIHMRDFVTHFEGIREQILSRSGTRAWSLIKLDKDYFGTQPNLQFLRRLQQSYYAELSNAIISQVNEVKHTDPEQAWQIWLREYADALINWCSIVYDNLCRYDFGFDDEKQKKLAQIRTINKYILFEKWVNTFSFFESLTQEVALTNYQLSCFNVITGQIVLYWMPDMQKCIPYFEKAKELAPENSKAVRSMGEYYLRKQEYEKARAAFLSSISIDSNDTEHYIFMGDSYKEERKLETAEQWYKDAININLLTTSSLGSLTQLNGQPEWYNEKKDLIEVVLRQAEGIEQNLETENGLYNRYRDAGHAHFAAPNYEAAKKYYEKACEIRPELVAAKLDVAYTCGYMKNFAEAETWFERSLSKDDEAMNFDSYWGYAWLYEQMNTAEPTDEKRDKAIRYYEQCMELRKELKDIIHNSIGLLYSNSGNYKKAIECFIKASELNPGQQVYLDNYTDTLSKFPDFTIADINTTRDNILNETGNFLYRKTQYVKAKQFYQKALELKEDPVYFENLGLANERLSMLQDAEESYARSIELDKETGNAFNRMGVFFYNQAKDDKAIQFYRMALDREPGNTIFLQNIAYAYESRLRYEEAKQVYGELLSADPANDNAYYRLALIALYEKDNEEAHRAITEALKLRPDNVSYLKTAGNVYENLNNYEEALKIYDQALLLNDSDDYFNNRAGIMHYRIGTTDSLRKATEFYTRAIQAGQENGADPVLAVYWQNLGLAYADLGELEEAEKAYLHSLEIDKETAENFNNIGSFYFNKKGDWKKAMEMYQQALKLNPNDSLYCRNLAASYNQLGDYKKADELYAKADELDGKAQEQPQTRENSLTN